MSVELRPLGVKCNIHCQYCYQNPQRDAGNVSRHYDMEKMKQAIECEGGPFTIFGGEPLLIPLNDLEDLWTWGLKKFNSNSIQTNGTLITEKHLHLFKKYNVHVGISIDGPGELNDARWHQTLEKTRESTQKSESAIQRLCEENMPPSLIITLHKNNATADKLPIMNDWIKYLASLGVKYIRLHLLESEDEMIRQKFALSTQENLLALKNFQKLGAELSALQFDVFEDMRRMLLGQDNQTTCIWNACDPYTTRAVRGVEGFGQKSNCGRTNKEGIDFVKANTPGYERYMALYYTPQESGGCQGCRFFMMCKGQCPGTAIDNDWRNRTEHCEVWKTLFEELEAQLINHHQQPLSVSQYRSLMEQELLRAWSNGTNTYMHKMLNKIQKQNIDTKSQYHPQQAKAYNWRDELQQLKEELKLWNTHIQK